MASWPLSWGLRRSSLAAAVTLEELQAVMQTAEQLTHRIAKLDRAYQEIIEDLLEKLESISSAPQLTLDQAIDEFEQEHPELLHLLAQ